ncbi:amidohydrolase family protein [Chloroflexota bacterium]
MERKAIWTVLSCLMAAILVLISCSPAAVEDEIVTPEYEEVAPPAAEQEVVTEEEAVTEEETPVLEEIPTSTPTPVPTTISTLTPTIVGPAPISEGSIPIIDVHSQVDQYVELEKIIQLMDEGGIAGVILSTRGTVTPEELVSFADNHPGRIIPAVRTKSYMQKEDGKYYKLLKEQVSMEQYGAMAEILMYHAQKGEKASLVVHYPDDEKVQAALDYALDKVWPFVIHIEFAAAGSERDEFMTKLEALLIRYPEHPFVLIHMGQLNHIAVRQLIEAHENIYFITSHSNPIVTSESGQPWTNMFNGNNLSADWKQLMVKHPGRFILGFDNVWAENWGQYYLDQIALWREAIKELPLEVAHAFAHGNAERLWNLQLVE